MGYLKIPNLYKPEAQDIFLFREAYCLEKIHGCLRFDMPVFMADGTQKPICEVEKGDNIVSFNEETKSYVSSEVEDIVIQEPTEHLDWYELELDNGQRLVCTEDHPILTEKGWITAKNLTGESNIVGIGV